MKLLTHPRFFLRLLVSNLGNDGRREEEVKIFPSPEELLVNMNHILGQRQQSAMVSSPDAPLKRPPSRGLARPRRMLAVVVVVFSEYNMLDQLYQI